MSEQPLTSSAGSHAVTNILPLGAMYDVIDVPILAPQLAALTHGAASAQRAATVAALLVAECVNGAELAAALAWMAAHPVVSHQFAFELEQCAIALSAGQNAPLLVAHRCAEIAVQCRVDGPAERGSIDWTVISARAEEPDTCGRICRPVAALPFGSEGGSTARGCEVCSRLRP